MFGVLLERPVGQAVPPAASIERSWANGLHAPGGLLRFEDHLVVGQRASSDILENDRQPIGTW
jgi:hypothetical protein